MVNRFYDVDDIRFRGSGLGDDVEGRRDLEIQRWGAVEEIEREVQRRIEGERLKEL